MKVQKIRLGLIGGGMDSMVGIVHRIAAYLGERYHIVGGVFSSDYSASKLLANKLDLDQSRIYPGIDELIEMELSLPKDQRIEVVSVLTPNFLHYSVAKKLITAGFNVICEKPMTFTVAEAEELEVLVAEKSVAFCLTHTYTGYPMVRQMREMIAAGAVGRIQKVDGQYYQGWINRFIHDVDKRSQVWRLSPDKVGNSCCFGDIGVHVFNLIEFTTGLQIERVLADVNTLYADNPLDVDGTALIKTADGVSGMIRASQIATGEENNMTLSVYGEKGGLKWEQENPSLLFYLLEGQPVQVFKPGNDYNHSFAQESSKLPSGHPEGLGDALGNIYSGFAKAVRGEVHRKGSFPGVADGVRGVRFVEAVIESNTQDQAWVRL